MDIAGKSAVVTGAGNGIGRAIALALAGRGANVCVADIELEAARAVADEVAEKGAALGVKSLAIGVDVRHETEMEALAVSAWEAFGSVELLFNNAGVMPPAGPLVKMSADDYRWTFDVNVGGVLNGIRVFAPRFVVSGQPAWIVNTGSEHSFGVPHLYGGIYTATKHALLGLSDVLRRELPDNVGVSVFCPGIVKSTLWKATTRRPEEVGGAVEPPATAGAAMEYGMEAEDVAEKVMVGIEHETFYIVTHPHVVEIARSRWEEAEAAFAEQAPRFDGDEKFDVNEIIKQLAQRDA